MRRSLQQLDKNEVAAAATGVSSDWSRSPAAAKKIVTNKVDEQLRRQRRQTFHTFPAEPPKGSSKLHSSPPRRVPSGITAAPRPTGNPPRSPPKVARSLVSSPLPRRVICSSSVTSSAPGSCSTSPSCVRGSPKPQARSLGDGGSLGGSPSGSPSGSAMPAAEWRSSSVGSKAKAKCKAEPASCTPRRAPQASTAGAGASSGSRPWQAELAAGAGGSS